MTLLINSIIKWDAIIASLGLLRREFGKPLLLTTDASYLNASRRTMEAAQLSDVTDAFATGSAPAVAAAIYFQQVPYPKNLVVGRWFNVDVPAILTGGAGHASVAELKLVTTGSTQINSEDVTGIDFSGDNSFSEMATTLETALNTATNLDLATATVAYDSLSKNFILTSGVDGAASVLTFASAAASGLDISELLGWTEATGASVVAGQDTETVEEALQAIVGISDVYFIANESALNDTQTVLDISAWVEAQVAEYQYSAESNSSAVTTTGEAASIFAQLHALQPERTWGTWSLTADYKALSIAGRFSSVNFSGSNTLITGKFKELPGTASDDITPTQKAELDRKRVNHYSPFSGDDIYVEGYCFKDGIWVDARYWLDWFVNALRVDQYNLLKVNPRVPQTEPGVASLQEVTERVCAQGVTNGGCAPGQLSAPLILDVQLTTGNDDFDGFLPKGYLIYYTAIINQAQSDREARKSVPGKVWLKGSGAIHFVEGSVIFEN